MGMLLHHHKREMIKKSPAKVETPKEEVVVEKEVKRKRNDGARKN